VNRKRSDSAHHPTGIAPGVTTISKTIRFRKSCYRLARQAHAAIDALRPIPTTTACANAPSAPARRPEASMMTCSARISSAIGNGSAILFRHLARSVQQRLFERRVTEEGVDPVQNRSERGFAQAPHPSLSFSMEERTTSVQHAMVTCIAALVKPSTESDQAQLDKIRRLVEPARRDCVTPSCAVAGRQTVQISGDSH